MNVITKFLFLYILAHNAQSSDIQHDDSPIYKPLYIQRTEITPCEIVSTQAAYMAGGAITGGIYSYYLPVAFALFPAGSIPALIYGVAFGVSAGALAASYHCMVKRFWIKKTQ